LALAAEEGAPEDRLLVILTNPVQMGHAGRPPNVLYDWHPFSAPELSRYEPREGLTGFALLMDPKRSRLFCRPFGRIPYNWLVFDTATRQKIDRLPVAFGEDLSSGQPLSDEDVELGRNNGDLFVLDAPSVLVLNVHIAGKWTLLIFNAGSLDLISLVIPPVQGRIIGVMPDHKTLVWEEAPQGKALALQTLARTFEKLEDRYHPGDIPTVIKSSVRTVKLPPGTEVISPAVAGRVLVSLQDRGKAKAPGAQVSVIDLQDGRTLAQWRTEGLCAFNLGHSGCVLERPYEVVSPREGGREITETRYAESVRIRNLAEPAEAKALKLAKGTTAAGMLPSGRYLYATDGRRMSLYEVETGRVVKEFSPGKDDPSGISGTTVYAGRPAGNSQVPNPGAVTDKMIDK
jgi:hypothetical protein